MLIMNPENKLFSIMVLSKIFFQNYFSSIFIISLRNLKTSDIPILDAVNKPDL